MAHPTSTVEMIYRQYRKYGFRVVKMRRYKRRIETLVAVVQAG